MKKALLLIALAICTLAAAQAGGIEGKWYCSKAMLDSLGLKKYPNIRGYYKFGKDGTFSVRIKGDRVLLRSSNSHGFAWKTPRYMRNRAKNQTVSIKVKGTYTTDGGTITTTVDPRDVYCYINTGLQNPTEPDASASWGEYYWAQHKINLYESVESTAERLANFIKTSNMHLWQWSGEPLAVTKDSLTVGAAMKFSRLKPERTYATGEDADPRPHPYCRIESEKADKAVAIVRKRKGTAKKKLWAIKALDEAVEKDSASWWLYHLGLAHLYGYGGKPDPAKATFFLEKAAQAGYGGKAYLALGMMYKDGKGGARQDFQKAYAYFCKGAGDDRKCQYAKGYMLYKGLGCKQDYQEAARALVGAANAKLGAAWYMVGLCSRNGYGLEKDSAAAAFCLKRAARLHCREAKMELARPREETFMHGRHATGGAHPHIPDSLPHIAPASGSRLGTGAYRGFVATYDWSGKYILGEMPMAIEAHVAGGSMAGTIAIGTDTTYCKGKLDGGTVTFDGAKLTLPERYERSGKMEYSLRSIVVDAAGGRLRGRLNLYSPKLKEPARPMYFELLKI